MLWIPLIFSSIYCLIVCLFIFGLIKIGKAQNRTLLKFSVIVAARNEEKYLPLLLEKLVKQDYPKENYEIIVADDRSTDNTSQIIEKFAHKFPILKSVRIIEESDKLIGKKNALNEAIKISKNEILAFTDADCVPSINWLRELNKHFDGSTDFVAGYSPLLSKGKKFNLLKNLERASHFAVVAGSLGLDWKITCAARNMAYRKCVFEKAEGFSGIGHLRSGDDDLMLQKIAGFVRKSNFMFSEDSIVPSFDKDNIREMKDLETRRASKWFYYTFPVKIMTLFFLIYFVVFGFSVPGIIIGYLDFDQFLLIFLLKIVPEFFLLFVFLLKVRRLKLLTFFPILELIYIPYYIFFGLKGTFGKYRWKN